MFAKSNYKRIPKDMMESNERNSIENWFIPDPNKNKTSLWHVHILSEAVEPKHAILVFTKYFKNGNCYLINNNNLFRRSQKRFREKKTACIYNRYSIKAPKFSP